MIAGLLCLHACQKYTLSRVYRAEAMYNPGKTRDTIPAPEGPLKRDTTVLVSAVIVPEGYDWRRDSSYGMVPCELQLLRNWEPEFAVPTGRDISISPDTHHLLGGHLYTECARDSGTVICRDGVPLFRYPERESLRGLLVDGETVYTLGKDLDGTGFYFRKDGVVLMMQDAGEVFGDFSNPAYGRNGALYRNEADVCFCYRNQEACYKVVNGSAERVDAGVSSHRVKDMRLIGRSVYYIADYSSALLIFAPSKTYTLTAAVKWISASLFLRGEEPWFIAESLTESICKKVSEAENASAGIAFSGECNFLFPGKSTLYSAGFGDGSFNIRDESGKLLYIRDSTHFFGGGSIYCDGNDVYAIINPRQKKMPPSVWLSGRERVVPLNGYLTGIEVNPARLRRGFRPDGPRCGPEESLLEADPRCSRATP